jgi:hypothetical protein
MTLRDSLDRTTMADVVDLLGRDAGDVAELRDAGDLLVSVLARVGLLLRDGNAAGAFGVGQQFARAVVAAWGEAPFQAGALLAWAEAPDYPSRRPVRDAAAALVRGELTARRLGMALERLANTPGGAYRLRRTGRRGGSAAWIVEREGDL